MAKGGHRMYSRFCTSFSSVLSVVWRFVVQVDDVERMNQKADRSR